MKTEKHDILRAKIEAGLKAAWRKLVIESAAKNRSLVLKVNGEIKHVPAKELLAGLDDTSAEK